MLKIHKAYLLSSLAFGILALCFAYQNQFLPKSPYQIPDEEEIAMNSISVPDPLREKKGVQVHMKNNRLLKDNGNENKSSGNQGGN